MLCCTPIAVALLATICWSSCVHGEASSSNHHRFDGRNCSTLPACYKAADQFFTSCTAGGNRLLRVVCKRHLSAMKLHCEAYCTVNFDNRKCDSCLDASGKASDDCVRFHQSYGKHKHRAGHYPMPCRHVRLYFFRHCVDVCGNFLNQSASGHVHPLGTKDSPATTGKDLVANPKVNKTGLYWIKPLGEAAPAQTCVDLSFDGGGWALASYGFSGSSSTTRAIPNMNHPNGYNWAPASRGNSNGLINLARGATFLARGAEHMLMAAGLNGNGCNIDSFSHVYKISIDTVKRFTNMTFANHSPYRGGRTMRALPFVVEALKGESGSPKRIETRFAFGESLGTTWPDSYPTMYGFCPTPDAGVSKRYDAGPAFPSVISGDGHKNGGGKAFPPDVSHGHEKYQHRGWYSLAGTGRTGHMTIWFR